MKYTESNLIELKRTLEDDMKSEIVAFLNSYLGGTIFIGVDDHGSIANLSDKEMDRNESKLINWIRDEAIYPNCSNFVKFHYNEDGVLVIKIEPGINKPYFIKSKGLKPSGVYIRYGRNKTQASQEEIARMIRERDNSAFESLISKRQDLTFNTLELKFNEKGFDFNNFKMITSGFIDSNSNLFTNLAFWVSDQYDVDTKMAVYQGLDRSVFRSKKEYSGSIINQIDKALEYFDLCNEVRVIINGSPTRTEIPSYNKNAARESVLNTYCHRDFSRKANIKIEFFDDRVEVLSPGGFYDGLTLEKALEGFQSFRNEYLIKLLFKLGYIENYASGLTRIFNEYKKDNIQPVIDTSAISFKVTLPNKNYEAFKEISNKRTKVNLQHGDVNEDNGDVNEDNGDVNEVNGSVGFIESHKDQAIYNIIKNNPGIRKSQILEILLNEYSDINTNILSKRIKLLGKYVEFKGAPKNGGYYIIKK